MSNYLICLNGHLLYRNNKLLYNIEDDIKLNDILINTNELPILNTFDNITTPGTAAASYIRHNSVLKQFNDTYAELVGNQDGFPNSFGNSDDFINGYGVILNGAITGYSVNYGHITSLTQRDYGISSQEILDEYDYVWRELYDEMVSEIERKLTDKGR